MCTSDAIAAVIGTNDLLPRQGWIYGRARRSLTIVYARAHLEPSSHRLIRRKEISLLGVVVLAKLISINGHSLDAPVASSPEKMKSRIVQ